MGIRRSNFMGANNGGGGGFGKALAFDGVEDYCDLPSAASGSVLTISVWFKLNALGLQTILGGNDVIDYFRFTDNTTIDIRGSKNLRFAVPATSINTWHHVLCVVQSNSGRLFINGVESSSGTVINAVLNLDFNTVGWNSQLNYFDGQLDNLLITNTASSTPQAQATALYNGGLWVDPLTVIPTAQQLYRFNGNGNNDGTLGGALTLINFAADPYVDH